jgi:hypothetical protein
VFSAFSNSTRCLLLVQVLPPLATYRVQDSVKVLHACSLAFAVCCYRGTAGGESTRHAVYICHFVATPAFGPSIYRCSFIPVSVEACSSVRDMATQRSAINNWPNFGVVIYLTDSSSCHKIYYTVCSDVISIIPCRVTNMWQDEKYSR